MNTQYFDKMSDMVKQSQANLHAFADLNMKTLQGYSTLKADDFSKCSRPEELLEKQLELAIENGHKALDYFQQSLQLIEKAFLCASKEVKNKTK